MVPRAASGERSAGPTRPPKAVFDSHCHLTDGRFDSDRAAVLDAALDAGVTRMVTVASNLQDARAAAELAGTTTLAWIHRSRCAGVVQQKTKFRRGLTRPFEEGSGESESV